MIDEDRHTLTVSFPLTVEANQETARQIARGEPRLIALLLYRAADFVATGGNVNMAKVDGGDLLSAAGVKPRYHDWAASVLVFLSGMIVGSILGVTLWN